MSHRVLLLGGRGLLGRALVRARPESATLFVPSHAELPLEEPDRIIDRIEREGIDRVLLAAAWTEVDACEADEARAITINGVLPGRLAARLVPRKVGLLLISTDYVFDGRGGRPFREFDPVGPCNAYGRSKWYGEQAVRAAGGDLKIVRTGALYGPGGPDFPHAILSRLGREELRVVHDQTMTPTHVDELAPALWRVLLSPERGIYHLTASGETTWFDYCLRLAELAGCPREGIRPIDGSELGRPAPRPAYSVLDCTAARIAFGIELRDWNRALTERFDSLLEGDPS